MVTLWGQVAFRMLVKAACDNRPKRSLSVRVNREVKALSMAGNTALHFSQQLSSSTRRAALSLTHIAIGTPREVVTEGYPADGNRLQEGHGLPAQGDIVKQVVADAPKEFSIIVNVPLKTLLMVATQDDKTRSALARSRFGKELKSCVTCLNVSRYPSTLG